jgi:hypothetical protein
VRNPNSEVAMDGYKLRRYGETREYMLEASSHLPETRRRRQKPFNKLIGAFEKCTNSLDSRAVDDSAVRTIAHHGSTKPQDGFPFAQHPVSSDQRKTLSKGHPGRSRTRSSFS